MKICTTLHFFTVALVVCHPAVAEVTLDGTLGSKGVLPGPDYQIGADLGQQHGGNLFHSFQDFNLQSHESATFSGPDNVQNIISRVTGGNLSRIDGTLRSTIPNADLYFLNPYGIMFGPNAKLDVQGGFHASTADYLRLSDGGRFEARTPGNSLLTVAPVAAFGFLTDSPAAIKTQDSQLLIPKGKTFSWIGGGLEFQSDTPLTYDENSNAVSNSKLSVESGRLNLASVAASGEVIPTAVGLDLTSSTKSGPITAINTHLSAGGEEGGGHIWIRGGQFEMTNSFIENKTVTQLGGKTDIQADSLTLEGGAWIGNDTTGIGSSGPLHLQVADELVLRGNDNNGYGSMISASSLGTMPQAGATGDILIKARHLNLADGAQINNSTFGTGQGSTVQLQVAETLQATGTMLNENYASGIYSSSVNAELENAGDAGNIIIQAREVKLTAGAQIGSSTFGAGQGGTVSVQVSETLTASGITGLNKPSSVIVSSNNTDLENAGDAGNLMIQARNVKLAEGATLSSVTWGTGQGGPLSLKVSETLMITGQRADGRDTGVLANSISDQLEKAGAAGNLDIEARRIILQNGGKIASNTYGAGQGGSIHLHVSETLTVSGRGPINGSPSGVSAGSLNSDELYGNGKFLKEGLPAGQAGEIVIQANTLNLLHDGRISTQQTRNTGGGGGNLTLSTANRLYLQEGQITTSVKGGKGDGGNITIDRPQFAILDKGEIRAQADEGRGGNIRIIADQFLKTPDSLISASSRLGIDGQVRIDSPDQTIGDTLLAGANTLNPVPNLLPRPCEWATFEEYLNRSTFYVYPIAGSTLSPYDLKPSLGFQLIPKLSTVGQASVSKVRKGDGTRRVAWLTECQKFSENS